VAFADLSLQDVREVKERLGVTVNDLVLATCSGALRSYLCDHDRHIDDALVAVVPVSVRQPSDVGAMGNRLSAMFVPLATDRDRPLDRVTAIAQATDAAKSQEAAIGYGEVAAAAVEAVPPALARPAVRLGSRLGLVRRLRPANLVVSNVPGPDVPLYFAGMRLQSVYPIGPVVDGIALNLTVQSYHRSLFVGINACPTAVPDVLALARQFVEEFTRLATVPNAAGRADQRPTGGRPDNKSASRAVGPVNRVRRRRSA
jgi:diacylglycerol O-acyltransferase